ncbi:response regulator [Deltaproteobacteria bacterium TL4]
MEKENIGHVLYVEDDKVLRNVISIQLKSMGCQVTTAIHGKEALEKIANEVPDLILTDAMMPVMNGHDFIKEIKKSNQYKEIPVIFISANTKDSSRDEAFTEGAVDYLNKPIVMKELVFKVRNFLDLAASHKDSKKQYQHQLHNALESVELLKDQAHIFTEIMKQTIALRRLDDIHFIADAAMQGCFQICGVHVNFWRHLSGKPSLMGTVSPKDEMGFNQRLALVSGAFELKEQQIQEEGVTLMYLDGYVMEILDYPQEVPQIMDILNLFFTHIADILNSFKAARLYQKVAEDLKSILKIRNNMVHELDAIRNDSNVNITNIGMGLEQLTDILYQDEISSEDKEQMRQLANDTLMMTQFGDTANQKVFAIINSLSKVFASLEDEVEIQKVELDYAIEEVSSDSIAQNETQTQQSDVDNLLAELGL